GFEEVRSEAEEQARAGGGSGAAPAEVGPAPSGPDQVQDGGGGVVLPEEGTPVSWEAGADEPAPRGGRGAAESGRRGRGVLATGEWVGLLAAVWALALAPGVRARARLLWPEQLAVVGGLGWYLAGRTPLVLGLLAVAAAGLVFRLG